ncbi:DUF2637 domain-containing protein [Sinomonas gamaensis]|uniref:DUF2637 domain-containing protein n=1 Tax=Sinomonas gamaensis TaxID=2565624 RepID=UPI0020165BF1|nr:DUF2637 domain-containing protein [Sinomonas gamaensis]
MALTALGLVAVLGVASFTLSFQGLIQAAAWAGIPPLLRWLVPIVVDSTILVYALAAAVQRARGENTRLSWAAVAFFTTVSVAANAAHVLAPEGVPAQLTLPLAFGAALAAIMPISLFFATESVVQMAVAPPLGTIAQRRKRALLKLAQERGEDLGALGLSADGSGSRASAGPRPGQRAGTTGPARPRVEADPAKVRELAERGMSHREIASELGLSKSSVGRILAGGQKGGREPVPAGT